MSEYTILSAVWANEAHDALTVVTKEAGAVSVGKIDGGPLWEEASVWVAANPIKAYEPPPPATARQKIEALGITAADLKAIMAEETV